MINTNTMNTSKEGSDTNHGYKREKSRREVTVLGEVAELPTTSSYLTFTLMLL